MATESACQNSPVVYYLAFWIVRLLTRPALQGISIFIWNSHLTTRLRWEDRQSQLHLRMSTPHPFLVCFRNSLACDLNPTKRRWMCSFSIMSRDHHPIN